MTKSPKPPCLRLYLPAVNIHSLFCPVKRVTTHTLGAGEATWNAQSAHAYHIGSIDCAPGSASEINGQLHKMFKTLKDVKKYGSEFIETAQNKVRDLQKDIKKI